MPKKKIELKPLQFIGATSGKYMDEKGQHRVTPGEVKEFTPAMYDFHLAEPVWKIPETIKDGD